MTLYEQVEALKPGTVFAINPNDRTPWVRTLDGVLDTFMAVILPHEPVAAFRDIPEVWRDPQLSARLKLVLWGPIQTGA